MIVWPCIIQVAFTFFCVFFCVLCTALHRKKECGRLPSVDCPFFFGFDFFQTISFFAHFGISFSKIALLNNTICLGIDKYDLLTIFFVCIFLICERLLPCLFLVLVKCRMQGTWFFQSHWHVESGYRTEVSCTLN